MVASKDYPGVLFYNPDFVVVHNLAQIGEGTRVGPFTRIGANARIGKNCVIGSHCNICEDTFIGDGVSIQTGCHITRGVMIAAQTFIGPGVITMNDKYMGHFRNDKEPVLSPPIIGLRCRIGGGSCLLPGVAIGNDVLIGSGSVVTKDVPEGKKAFGNPARVQE